jgi:hypothetical protein
MHLLPLRQKQRTLHNACAKAPLVDEGLRPREGTCSPCWRKHTKYSGRANAPRGCRMSIILVDTVEDSAGNRTI